MAWRTLRVSAVTDSEQGLEKIQRQRWIALMGQRWIALMGGSIPPCLGIASERCCEASGPALK